MKIAIIGDRDPAYLSQQATEDALRHSAAKLGLPVEPEWLPTAGLTEREETYFNGYGGYWIAPGFPESEAGVLRATRFARERDIPLLATCGGFQSLLLEYARNVLGMADAAHEERAPDSAAASLLISRLACSLAGQRDEVRFRPSSRVSGIYRAPAAVEHFRCHYGLNPRFLPHLEQSALHIAGTDRNGEPRIVELPEHRFYVGTLFVPQLSSTPDASHCLVDAFVEEAVG